MPTYEYVCKNCGHLFEIVQSMKDDPLTECPECAGELRKVFAPPAISFKGSGFYATDHGKKAKKSEVKKEGSSEGAKKESGGDPKDSGSGSSKGSDPQSSGGGSSSGGSSSEGSSSGSSAGGTTTKKESAS
jgi:putative FmdB family regulatory protein